ncbi:hypothetical protein BDN71DRAFT_521112 [Pleurotus eryngii]|uniref:Uncharacterized protein n=1 Tax=Pleurotus eryngii TaxID=5323 RepID=A0A9P6D267_PLEER|nr:hypothetical protein BDN71DRAFT_521112 [Pleurotus eryngii]
MVHSVASLSMQTLLRLQHKRRFPRVLRMRKHRTVLAPKPLLRIVHRNIRTHTLDAQRRGRPLPSIATNLPCTSALSCVRHLQQVMVPYEGETELVACLAAAVELTAAKASVGIALCSNPESRFIVRIHSFRLLLVSVRYQLRPHCLLGTILLTHTCIFRMSSYM